MHRFVLILFTALAVIVNPGAAVLGTSDASANANPIRRVVTLLQKMAEKVAAEGEREEELHDKFVCYCRTSGGDLAQSIAENTAKVPQVQSEIEQAEASVKQLDLDTKSHQEDRSAAKAAMEAATAQRENEHKVYLATSGEYKGYVSALAAAIPAIQKGMAGGFLQADAGARARALQRAVASAASVTDYDRQLVTSFLSGGVSAGYVPKGGEITGILQQIKEDFEKSLAQVESEEAAAVKLFEELVAAKTKQVATLGDSIEKKVGRVGDLKVGIVSMKNDMSDSEAALVADQKFAADLETGCSTKTAEWEERKKLRTEELVAIHDTIKALQDDDALELFKKTLPSASLLQVEASSEQLRRRALSLLRAAEVAGHRGAWASRPGLDFVLLALTGKAVDFTKVIKMIDGMVTLLEQEQTDDEHKKDYCEAHIDMTEDKAKALAKKVEDLETTIAEKEEAISTLVGEIKALTAGIAALDKSVAEATEQRKEEHEEYVGLLSSNNAAKELLDYAKNRLNKFYNPALYKAPEEVAAESPEAPSLVQVVRHMQGQRAVPPPPPATWGAYSKKGQEATGVISMIDLLVKDLDKEITEAEVQEKDAQKEYETAMIDAARKRAADLQSVAQKESAKADAEESKASASASKTTESKQLMATKQYEMELHQECDWLMQNFDLRKSARAQEMDALKQSKAVLSGADFALVQKAGHGALMRRLRGQ